MNKEAVLKIVQDIFRDVFDRPELELSFGTQASDISDWDSLMHINLVVAIEKEFKLKFGLAELQELKNVGDMIDLIISKSPSHPGLSA